MMMKKKKIKLPDMWLIKRASAAPAARRYYSKKKKKKKKKKKNFFFFFFFFFLEIVARRGAALARFGGIPVTTTRDPNPSLNLLPATLALGPPQ